MKKPKIPKEDPQIGQLRDRQIVDLAKQDELLNQKLKMAFMLRRGARIFRPSGSSSSSGGSSGGGSGGFRNGGGRAFTPGARRGGMAQDR